MNQTYSFRIDDNLIECRERCESRSVDCHTITEINIFKEDTVEQDIKCIRSEINLYIYIYIYTKPNSVRISIVGLSVNFEKMLYLIKRKYCSADNSIDAIPVGISKLLSLFTWTDITYLFEPLLFCLLYFSSFFGMF